MSSHQNITENPAIKDCIIKIKTILDAARGEGKRSLSRAELNNDYYQFYGTLLGETISRCGFSDSTIFLRNNGFDATDYRISVETAIVYDAATENQVSLMQRTPGSKGNSLARSYAKHRVQRRSSSTTSNSSGYPAIIHKPVIDPPKVDPPVFAKREFKASDFVDLGVKMLAQCKITTYEDAKRIIPNFDQLIGESDDESL